MKQKWLFFWKSRAFSLNQKMLAVWSLVPLPFLNPAWTSGNSRFMFCWNLVWSIFSIIFLMWNEHNCVVVYCHPAHLTSMQSTKRNAGLEEAQAGSRLPGEISVTSDMQMTFFGIVHLWDWNENCPSQVLWPLLSFPDGLAYRVQHLHSII